MNVLSFTAAADKLALVKSYHEADAVVAEFCAGLTPEIISAIHAMPQNMPLDDLLKRFGAAARVAPLAHAQGWWLASAAVESVQSDFMDIVL